MKIYRFKLFLFLLFVFSSEVFSQTYIYPDTSGKWVASTKFYSNHMVYFLTYLDDSLNAAFNQKINSSTSKIEFELGARDQMIFMFTSFKSSNGTSRNAVEKMILPINLHITAGVRFYQHYKIDFRAGIMFIYDDYMGNDEGIFFQADLFKSKFYAAAGIDFFNNTGNAHGTMYYSESGGSTTFYCAGLGYTIAKVFNIDAMYYIPHNKVYGHSIDLSGNVIRTDKINNGLLVLGFQYSFTF